MMVLSHAVNVPAYKGRLELAHFVLQGKRLTNERLLHATCNNRNRRQSGLNYHRGFALDVGG